MACEIAAWRSVRNDSPCSANARLIVCRSTPIAADISAAKLFGRARIRMCARWKMCSCEYITCLFLPGSAGHKCVFWPTFEEFAASGLSIRFCTRWAGARATVGKAVGVPEPPCGHSRAGPPLCRPSRRTWRVEEREKNNHKLTLPERTEVPGERTEVVRLFEC